MRYMIFPPPLPPENVTLSQTRTYDQELTILTFSELDKDSVVVLFNFSPLVSASFRMRSIHSSHSPHWEPSTAKPLRLLSTFSPALSYIFF